MDSILDCVVAHVTAPGCSVSFSRSSAPKPEEHPTASELRKLAVLAPISERDSQWLLMRGRKTNVRGWIGPGREYVRNLGASSFGTAVPFPVHEALAQNIWVKWAMKDPEGSKHFWREVQKRSAGLGGPYLFAAQAYLEEHKLAVVAADVEAHAHRFVAE